MHLTKIYTRTGDKGTTALIGGERVQKTHLRLECYGTLDELNAFVGKLKVVIGDVVVGAQNIVPLQDIQQRLFDIGTMLATPTGKEWENMPSINELHVKALEQAIDAMNAKLEPLKNFTTPGSSLINAEAHICRTVCRRAERFLCNAKENGIAINETVMAYVNRLSDYFFVLSRLYSETAT